MTDAHKEIRDFVFRGLLFESESEALRRAGIRVGADIGQAEEALLFEALAPFGVQRRNRAMEMARLYAVLHAFENEVRSLISDTLEEKVSPDWWASTAVPKKIRDMAESRQKTALRDAWLEGEKTSSLEYADFGDLSNIITNNWEYFKDVIPSHAWISQRMTELEKARNFVAHHRMLLPSEFQRIYMYISDWNKVVGI